MCDSLRRWGPVAAIAVVVGVSGCRKSPNQERAVNAASSQSKPAHDERLEITLLVRPEVRMERVPMRTAVLRFRNLTSAPLRLYLPTAEPFRAMISTLYFYAEGGAPLSVPEPRPHGYVITERDFPLLAAGETRDFTQSFTLDPLSASGTLPERLTGFEPGRPLFVRWFYENSIRRWEGGATTLDGVTKPLFDGGDIPHIWTGKLVAEMPWTAPE
ncbi:MAG: hypothetical protein KF718_30900 [Polyangiaceae bacterium]|nr:hypothetical protein [Polyangiaceae bacterium]